MRIPLKVLFLCLLVPLLAGGGCAKNTVPLTYTPTSQEIIPIAGAPSICIVSFNDGRPETSIGLRSDGSTFTAEENVAEWVSQALGTELSRLGYVVTVAPTEQQARLSKASYIIIGNVQEVWLTENSSTLYDCRMRAAIELKKNTLGVMKNVFNSSLSRRVVPLTDVTKDLLAETLQGLVHPMALAVRNKISQ